MAEPEKQEGQTEAPRRFSPEVFAKILAALREKNVGDTCPRCHTDNWLVDATNLAATGSTGFQIPPLHISVLVFICKNCGFVALHIPSSLGLDPKELGLQ